MLAVIVQWPAIVYYNETRTHLGWARTRRYDELFNDLARLYRASFVRIAPTLRTDIVFGKDRLEVSSRTARR
jgi:hypothetical protein